MSRHMEFFPTFASQSTYVFRKKIGGGGCAEVFLYSRQADGLPAQDVAIKILKVSDEDLVRELLNEGRRLGSLKHPHILATFGYEKLGDNVFGLVLEYFPGENLKSVISRIPKRSRPRAAAYLARVICEALAMAHAQGIIHGDLSGRNILLSGQGQVKLSDFGLARRADSESEPAGPIRGSADSMAPELWAGGRPTFESDVFSVGLLIWELLSGDTVLRGRPTGAGDGKKRVLDFLKCWDSEEAETFPGWKNFLKGCLVEQASNRLSAKELLALLPAVDDAVIDVQNEIGALVQINETTDRAKTQTHLFRPQKPQSPPRLKFTAGLVLMFSVMTSGATGLDHLAVGRLHPCLLTLMSRPWGELFVDGVSRGYTPFVNLPIAPGIHVLTWKDPAGKTLRRSLTAFENGTLAYKIYMQHGKIVSDPIPAVQTFRESYERREDVRDRRSM